MDTVVSFKILHFSLCTHMLSTLFAFKDRWNFENNNIEPLKILKHFWMVWDSCKGFSEFLGS